MMLWRKKRDRVDPAVLEAQATDAHERLVEQQERVNLVTTYLERRKLQNGFGADFEFSLIPKGTK